METEIHSQQQQNNEDTTNSVEVAIRSEDTEIKRKEDDSSTPKTDVPQASEASGEEEKVKVLEPEKNDAVVDVIPSGGSSSPESSRAEKVCRICHISSEDPSENLELIQLGCGCKGELGVSHRRCAETWFKHKGNRQCEICGKTAKNITGIQDTRIYMVEFNETRMMSRSTNRNEIRSMRRAESPLGRESSCQCNHSCCNFLLACLVLAFVLPWFFRVNMLR